MSVDVGENWLLTAGVSQVAWVWRVENVTIPALDVHNSPAITPAALVNPYTTVDPNQEACVGHVIHGWIISTGVVSASVWYQFRVPTGTGTWHTFAIESAPLFQAKAIFILSSRIVPCVPQIRLQLNNGGGAFPCPVEGAFTIVCQ